MGTIIRSILDLQENAFFCLHDFLGLHRKAEVITLVGELGMTLPAGLTRHVLTCGRVLNVNVPLALLQADLPAAEKTARLQARLAGQCCRVYAEPTLVYEAE